jgi:agmatine deiminase
MSAPHITQPAEWEAHQAVWLAWPSHEDLWEENTAAAREEFVGLCRGIADVDSVSGKPRGEKLKVLVPNEAQKKLAEKAIGDLSPEFHLIPFGDIWLRDTGPIFVRDEKGTAFAHSFAFNGWGGKYVLDHDTEVSGKISAAARTERKSFSWILEGGSVEANGAGTCLTSRQCLLNPNRNVGVTEKEMEAHLKAALGHDRVIWLERGLVNDHTDGHIDTIARFVAKNTALCMKAADASDPNFAAMNEIERDLRAAGLEVITVPSPGKVTDEEGEILAASYLNFYIGNTTVVVPTYGKPNDEAAVAVIAKCFPTRKTIGRSALAILSGGGAFHCISQQEPL